MWKLPSPSTANVITQMEEAFTYKIKKGPKYNLTPNDKKDILDIYHNYDLCCGRPADFLKGEHLGLEFRNAIREAYGEVQETGRLKSLRAELKLAARYCPMCGFGQIQDLDHHLPKSAYPSLSIYPRNLVPGCSTCNKKKLALAAAEPEKNFIHPYLEDLPDTIFLAADVELLKHPLGLKVNFKILKNGMSLELYKRILFQFERLGLQDRCNSEAINYLTSLSCSFETIFGEDRSAFLLKKFLNDSCNKNIRDLGQNHWKTALMRGLWSCHDFYNGGFYRALGGR